MTGLLPAPTALPHLKELPVPTQQESTFFYNLYVLVYLGIVLQIMEKPTIQKTLKSKAFWIKDSILIVQEVQMAVLSNRSVSVWNTWTFIFWVPTEKEP